jgi:hypothetical protein
MKNSLTTLALLATASTLTIAATMASAEPAAKPMFGVLPAHGSIHQYAHTPTALQTWNGSFVYNTKTYNYTMVGTNPNTTNTTTTIDIFLIPVKMKYSKKIYGKALKATFDPLKDQWNGETIMDALLNSPIFTSIDWQWGPTDMGTTQYEDAFQRGTFWGAVGSTNTAYHLVFGTPTVLAEQTIKVSKAQGGNVINNPFGSGKVGEMNINSFDQFIQTTLSKFSSQINPSNFPFFIVDNVYLTSGGCCIGGYHSADNNGQTYGMASFVTSPGAFSEDIDAISHEFGEWYDDPLTNNAACSNGEILEVGDPIEGLANYGTFPVTENGNTYHPQALTFLEYFGAPANTSANNWLDNQHLLSGVCSNGG